MNTKKRLLGSDLDLFSVGARMKIGIFPLFHESTRNHRRKRWICVYVLSFIFLVVFYPACLFRLERTSYKIEFCRFELDYMYMWGNANFIIFAAFELDSEGKPVNIYVSKQDPVQFIEPSKIIDCIEKWRITGARKGCRIVAWWQWRHGIGWLPLKITSREFMLEIE